MVFGHVNAIYFNTIFNRLKDQASVSYKINTIMHLIKGSDVLYLFPPTVSQYQSIFCDAKVFVDNRAPHTSRDALRTFKLVVHKLHTSVIPYFFA